MSPALPQLVPLDFAILIELAPLHPGVELDAIHDGHWDVRHSGRLFTHSKMRTSCALKAHFRPALLLFRAIEFGISAQPVWR